MTSTLFGIYNAQRALNLNQAVMDLINNNISNINTPGYSKQRAEIAQLASGNISSSPMQATQDVMGAIINDISRNRDSYLDSYYRKETSQYNYYKELNENSNLIEDITSELDNIGINYSLDQFYEALSQLSSNPTDIVARNNAVQKAIELTTKFNSVYTRLEDLRENLVGDISNPSTLADSKLKIAIDDLNDKLGSVADLNDSIILATSQGSSPNYLLDQRDMLLDEISELIPLNITGHDNGSITLSVGSTTLVSAGNQVGFFEASNDPLNGADINNPAIVQIKNEAGGVLVSDAYSVLDSGQIGGILEMGGSEANKLTIKSVMDELDTLAYNFANEFNTIQINGRYMDTSVDPPELSNNTTNPIDGALPLGPDPEIFFEDPALGALPGAPDGFAGTIAVNEAIINDPYQIAAADAGLTGAEFTETGDGSNALKMAQLRDTTVAALGGATTEQFITNLVGDVGSKANSIKNNYDIKQNVAQQVQLKRESVVGINLDEEMTDLIRFQRSYEASAKVFNVVNQNIQTILAMVR